MLTENPTLSKPLWPAKYEETEWRNLRLRLAFAEFQAVLGECMYAAGIDDGELGAKSGPWRSSCTGLKLTETLPKS